MNPGVLLAAYLGSVSVFSGGHGAGVMVGGFQFNINVRKVRQGRKAMFTGMGSVKGVRSVERREQFADSRLQITDCGLLRLYSTPWQRRADSYRLAPNCTVNSK